MFCRNLITLNEIVDFKVKKSNIYLENGIIKIIINNGFLNGITINQILRSISYVHKKYPARGIPIHFRFIKKMVVIDKLSYAVFECICNSLINDYGHKVTIFCEFDYGITTQGIVSSPLLLLSHVQEKSVKRNSKFLDKFEKDIYRYHYRRVLYYDEYNGKKLGQVYDDIVNFQKSFSVNYECIDKIAEVVVELVCNSIEHTKSDCLLDIDLAPNYINSISKEQYCGINIAVLNFSDLLLGDKIKEKLFTYKNCYQKTEVRYSKVLEALDFHKQYFSDKYDETDFFNIASFQHKISGRENNYTTGGTGLTLLIKSIEERADEHSCYALSGNRIISFIPEYLSYDENDWLGFNPSNDFFKSLPDENIINRASFFFPGTAYNLNFIMKVNQNEKNSNN